MTTQIPLKSIETTTEIIDLLSNEGPLGVSEIADELDLPKSTTHDHLRTLISLKLIENTKHRYDITSRFLEIGARWRYNQDVYRVGKDEVDNLAKKVGEHVSLSIEEDGEVVVLYTAKGPQSIRMNVYAGRRSPINTTATGKVLLAYLPDERVDEIIEEKGLAELTDNTITDREELLEELETIRERKFAKNIDEQVTGISGYAVHIQPKGQEVKGAISVYGPSHRINSEAKEKEITERLQEVANVIEVDLAYL